jgi:hypothetical protein
MFHPSLTYWPYPQTIDYAGKTCQGQTPWLTTTKKCIFYKLCSLYNKGSNISFYRNNKSNSNNFKTAITTSTTLTPTSTASLAQFVSNLSLKVRLDIIELDT